MTTGDIQMTDHFEVQDGSRIVSFEGSMIASVTSRDRSKARWTELRLYQTEDEKTYILEKVGRSVMVHMPGCESIVDSLERFQETHPGMDPDDGFWYCELCCDRGDVDITALLVELDRRWVTITSDPADVIDALYRRRSNARHLPRISLELLEQAARADDRVRDAYRVEKL